MASKKKPSGPAKRVKCIHCGKQELRLIAKTLYIRVELQRDGKRRVQTWVALPLYLCHAAWSTFEEAAMAARVRNKSKSRRRAA